MYQVINDRGGTVKVGYGKTLSGRASFPNRSETPPGRSNFKANRENQKKK